MSPRPPRASWPQIPERSRMDWAAQAACADSALDEFHADQGEAHATVKRVCAACPVVDACLQWAIENRERFGVWGGLSATERDVLFRDRAPQATEPVAEGPKGRGWGRA